jgi:hypothetical protein
MKLPRVPIISPMIELADREKKAILAEFVKVRGLMPLLMKPRNRQKWSKADRQELREHLRRLSRISPYLAILVMPGGLAVLPVLAWWLDRRRGRRATRHPETNVPAAAPALEPPAPTAEAEQPRARMAAGGQNSARPPRRTHS